MSDVRIIDTPRIEVDFTETDTTGGDYRAAIDAHIRAAEAAKSLGWKRYRISVHGGSYEQWTVTLERDDQ